MPTLAEIGIKLSKLDVVCMLGALSDSIVTLDEAANEIKTDIDKTNNAFTPEELKLIKNSSIEDIEFKFSVDKTFLTLSNPKYPNGSFNVQNEDVVTFLKNAKENKTKETLETLFTNHIQSQAKKRAKETFSSTCDPIIKTNFGDDLTKDTVELLKDELQKQLFNTLYSFLTNFKNEYKAQNEYKAKNKDGADSFGEKVVALALKDEVINSLIQDLEAVEIDELAANRVVDDINDKDMQRQLFDKKLPDFISEGGIKDSLQKKLDNAVKNGNSKKYTEVYRFCVRQKEHQVNFKDATSLKDATILLQSLNAFPSELARLEEKLKKLEQGTKEFQAADKLHEALKASYDSYSKDHNLYKFTKACDEAVTAAESKLDEKTWFKGLKQCVKLIIGSALTLGIANFYNHKTSKSGSYDFTKNDNDRVRKRVEEMKSTLKDLSFFKPDEENKENDQGMLNNRSSSPGSSSQQ